MTLQVGNAAGDIRMIREDSTSRGGSALERRPILLERCDVDYHVTLQVGNAAGDIRMIVNGYRADELENDALPGTLVTIVHSVCVCV